MTPTQTDPGALPQALAPASVVAVDAVAAAQPIGARETWRAIKELTKPRITRLVTITSGVGFVMGAVARPEWFTLDLLIAAVGALAGTALSSAGASALNQWLERDRDALMPRTCDRPLPRNKVTPATALGVGILLCIAGVTTLLLLAGPAAASVSLATILLYVLLYTPLKPVTTVATIIGAVPGALPPLIGWCAATADLSAAPFAPLTLAGGGGWSLFLLMFVWQIPHTLAIAWMYREDYAKGGYRILPLADPTGMRTAWIILLWAAAQIPATLSPSLAMPGRLGYVYPAFAIMSGFAYFYLCALLARDHTRANARRVFLASIMHLPLLLVIMVADAVVSALL
jgi:protoheme IX farnesyltransferase